MTYQQSINGGAWTAANSNVTDRIDGVYQYRAVVSDLAGNAAATSNVVNVTVGTAGQIMRLSASLC